MLKTIEAVVEADSHIRVLERVDLIQGQRVLVTLLDDLQINKESIDSTMLSEKALAVDWDREDEEKVWSNLQ